MLCLAVPASQLVLEAAENSRRHVLATREFAVRSALAAVAQTAEEVGYEISPLWTLPLPYTSELFLQVRKSPIKPRQLGQVQLCQHCQYHTVLDIRKTRCPVCDSSLEAPAALWTGRICDPKFAQILLRRMSFVPSACDPAQVKDWALRTELSPEVLGFSLDGLREDTLAPHLALRHLLAVLTATGFSARASSLDPGFIKTNAPANVVYQTALQLGRGLGQPYTEEVPTNAATPEYKRHILCTQIGMAKMPCLPISQEGEGATATRTADSLEADMRRVMCADLDAIENENIMEKIEKVVAATSADIR